MAYAGSTASTERMNRLRTNPNYMAKFVYQPKDAGEEGGVDGGVINLYLPENFQFNFSSSFDQPFSQGMVNAPGIQNFVKFFGASLTSQSMSVQVWQGTQCPEFNLTFDLIAEDSASLDVMAPIKKLSKLCLPGVNNGLLTPPGPRFDLAKVGNLLGVATKESIGGAVGAVGGAVTGDFTKVVGSAQSAAGKIGDAASELLKAPENNVKLHIGRFLVFPSVVIQNVSQTYNTLFNEQGLPIRASIDVSLSTWYVPVKKDINNMLAGG